MIFAAGSAVAITLIIGIAVSSWQANRAKALVREASRFDTATGVARLAESKWQEGVAYLGRAIRYDPNNQNAQDALCSPCDTGS
jgi:hypothetical protein